MGTNSSDTTDTSRAGHRGHVRALDGLRGLAAAIVVIYHSLLASSPGLESQYWGGPAPLRGSLDWWLSATPLHIFWAGPEMVIVFFVLSGYVLALPAVKRGWDWLDISYYARRAPRLYIPFWGALILAAVVHRIPAHNDVGGMTGWLGGHGVALPSLSGALPAFDMWNQPGAFQWNSVIWSLHWEIEFSVLLPLFLVAPLLTRRRPLLALPVAALCLGLIWLGSKGQPSGQLIYMPVFVLGSLLAFHRDRLPAVLSRRWEPVALIVCVVLLTGDDWLANASAPGIPDLLVSAGAAIAVWLATASTTLRGLLESRPGHALGVRSYSLYLVHEPILVSTAFLLGGHPSPWLLLAAALPVIAVVTAIFYRCVERPAIGIARACGHRVQTAVARRTHAREQRAAGATSAA